MVLADKYLGEAPKNPDIQDLLDDARETGKDVFPVGITTPALGAGTSAGQAVGVVADAAMEIAK